MRFSPMRLIALRLFVLLAISVNCLSATAAQSQVGKRILIVYFSQPEDVTLEGVDGVSGASVLQKNNERLGSTQYIAQIIQQQTGGELFRIETVTPYPVQHDPLLQYAEKEQKENVRPVMKAKVQNLKDYDTVFIGYPIWWYKMPMVLYSFLEQHDLQGKTIIPFTTHGGSRFSDSLREIARLQPNSQLFTEGLAISRNDVTDDETITDVINWLGKLPREQK
ncbi:flavodoxin [Pectobacterium versatile]|uniref:flavodoxin n=1 Tax=Pectobacterium versatile TaxID=2488639 RepID=UPI001CF4DE0A|nr:flavodoxin [Pectobacterium versatile]MCA6927604.1 flavodoxin [Pectobacterium versatile]MCH5084349.1 flavodoxin [Pectobacterium versatile]